MRRAWIVVLVIVLVIGWIGAGKAQTIKKRINQLEGHIETIWHELREIKAMVREAIPSDLDLTIDANDPTIPGDIKVVSGNQVTLDNCDSANGWSLVSGNNTTITLQYADIMEGNSALRIQIPPSTTAIVQGNFAAANIADQAYLNTYLRRTPTVGNMALFFGETNYNEQTTGNFTLSSPNIWGLKQWDIGNIAANNRNGVTKFGLLAVNTSNSINALVYIDFIHGDPGPSQIKGKDLARVITLYPKIFLGQFTSSGNNQTVYVSANGTSPSGRKGTPALIGTIRGGSATYNGLVLRHKDMTANNSVRADGGAMLSDGILSMGEGFFTVGDNVRVNPGSNETIWFIALYED